MNIDIEQIKLIIPFIIPILVVEGILVFISLRHIFTHDSYKRGNRVLWVVITLVGNQIWGPVLYFIFGKEDD